LDRVVAGGSVPYKELEVGSTTELIEAVLKLGEKCEGRALWHRGHTSATHTLTPSLYRRLTSTDEIFKVERRLLTRFRQRSLPYWPAGYPQNDWEHLFAMQHYGIPTRLLDWTENLLVGLYFAALPAEPSVTPAIWTLDPIKWNQSAKQLQDFTDVGILTTDSEELKAYAAITREGQDLVQRYVTPLAIYGTHNSPRIVAQRGAFTVAGKSLDGMERLGPDNADALWKITLNYDREEMVSDLGTLGFAESMVFPDLVGLSKEITATEGLT
jgi:hypothetical protein